MKKWAKMVECFAFDSEGEMHKDLFANEELAIKWVKNHGLELFEINNRYVNDQGEVIC